MTLQVQVSGAPSPMTDAEKTDVLTTLGAASTAALTAHTGSTSNPHGVTKAQVGLSNVDNTADADKPVSVAQAAAIAAVVGVTNLSATASPTGVTVTSDTGNDAMLPLADGVNAGLMAPTQATKLAGIAAGATANATDAQLRDRATHTGTQATSTIAGLDAALAGKATTAQGAKADTAIQPGAQLTQASVTAATAAGVALLGAADATAQRAALGLGTAATSASTAFATAAQGAKSDTALQPGELPVNTTVTAAQISDAGAAGRTLLKKATLPEIQSLVSGDVINPAAPAIWNDKGNQQVNMQGALPRLFAKLVQQDDSAPVTIRILGLGSSVGAGAALADPTTQAPVIVFANQLRAALNTLGNYNIVVHNGSVGGTTITDGVNTHYAAGKTALGAAPDVVFCAYGMNDGAQGQYHTGQTYTGCYSASRTLFQMIRGDNADIVWTTSPSPHSTKQPWGTFTGPIAYPASGVQIPANTVAASAPVADYLQDGRGSMVASYRHIRINQQMRRAANDTGVLVLDVERYWLEAVRAVGENALYDGLEYAHPNLLGHQLSYNSATAQFCRSLVSGRMHIPPLPKLLPSRVSKASNTAYSGTDFTNDNQLTLPVGANSTYIINCHIFYSTDVGADIKFGFSVPSGSSGRFGVQGPAHDATTYDTSPGIYRATIINGGWLKCGGIGADGYMQINGVLVTGAVAGNITMQFGQVVATGSAVVYGQSVMSLTPA